MFQTIELAKSAFALLTVCGLATTTVLPSHASAAAPIYKVVDANGHVTFTDRMPNGAGRVEAVELVGINTLPSRYMADSLAPTLGSDGEDTIDTNNASASAIVYTPIGSQPAASAIQYRLDFITPAKPQPYRKPTQNIEVALKVSPSLQAGDTLQILVDGKQVAEGTTASIPTLELLPGEHTLTAQVAGENGSKGAASQTFYVIQQNLAIQQKRALAQKVALYNRLPIWQKLYFNLRQDNPFADVVNADKK